MKKTLTVNLGGTVFHIDEDAYQLLDKYLAKPPHPLPQGRRFGRDYERF